VIKWSKGQAKPEEEGNRAGNFLHFKAGTLYKSGAKKIGKAPKLSRSNREKNKRILRGLAETVGHTRRFLEKKRNKTVQFLTATAEPSEDRRYLIGKTRTLDSDPVNG